MAIETERRAQEVIEQLRARGHHEAADRLASVRGVERGFLFALREACETVLTAIEAIDPVMQTMIEELRVEVESRLRLKDAPERK
jgi:hypothetical protein